MPLKFLLNFSGNLIFKKKAAAENAIIIDAKKTRQRVQKFLDFDNVLSIPLDRRIKNITIKERMKDKRLLIFDQLDKQVN